MADRSVTVLLGADVGRYLNGMQRAEAATNRVAASTGKANTSLGGFLKTAARSSAVLGLAKVVKDSVELEAQYSKTMAMIAVQTKAPQNELKELDRLALKMGADTVFSAQDAADAMLELAKGGLSTAQIKAGALSDTLTLASAGGLDLSDAANTVVQSMGAFQLKANQTNVAVAALAGAANASSADVSDMTQALSQAGTSSRSAGLSIQETTAFLALFANQGFKGSDAGTSLRTMLSRLVPQTDQARAAMKSLGLTYVDGNGKLVDAVEIADRTQKAFKGLSDEQRISAVNTIFGADAQRGVNAITAEGAKGLEAYIKQTSDLTQAQKLAQAANSGTSGSLEQLKGTVETAEIQLGKGLAPTIREIADGANDLVQNGDFERWGKEAGEGLQAFGKEAAPIVTSLVELGHDALPAAAAGFKTVAAGVKVALDVLGPALDLFGKLPSEVKGPLTAAAAGFAAAGPWGAAIAGGVSLLGSFGQSSREAAEYQKGLAKEAQGVADALNQQNGELTQNATKVATQQLAKSGALRFGDKLGVSYNDTVQASVGDESAQNRVNTAVAKYYELIKQGKFGNSFEDKVNATKELANYASQVGATSKAIDDQRKVIDDVNKATLEQSGAFGDVAQNLLNLSGDSEKYAGALSTIPDDVRTRVVADGAKASKEDVDVLAKAYGLTPKQVRTLLRAIDQATQPITDVGQSLRSLDGQSATVTLTTLQRTIKDSYTVPKGGDKKPPSVKDMLTPYTGMRLPTGYMGGGKVPGVAPLDPTVDNVLAAGLNTGKLLRVRSGEWIINEKASKKNDGVLRAINNGLDLSGLLVGVPGYAAGGVVDDGQARYDAYQNLQASTKLDVLHQQQTIHDLQKRLAERETVGKGKNKHKRDVLRGVDRRVAQAELAEAKRDLAHMLGDNVALKGYGNAAQEKALYDAAQSAATAATTRAEAATSAASGFGGTASISGLTSTAAVDRKLTQSLANMAEFTQVLADLKAAGAAPWLLDQLMQTGPTKTAIRLGRQYLSDTTALAKVNAQAAQLEQITSAYGQLTTAPEYTAGGAWSGGLSTAQRELLVSISTLDASTFAAETTRQVTHSLETLAAGGGL